MIMKLLKIGAIVLGGMIFTTLMALFLLPSFLSTETGKSWALELANKQIPGKVHVSEMKLNWFSPSTLKSVTLFDKNGKVIATVDNIDLNNSLWKLLTSSRPRPIVVITNLNADIVADQTGTTNLEEAIFFDKSLSGNLFDPIQLINTSLKSELNGNTVHVDASGNTVQGPVKGSFDIKGNFGREIEGDFNINDFPVVIFDQVLSLKEPRYKGLLKELLGNQFSVKGSARNNVWVFNLSSGNLKGEGEGNFQSDEWLLTKPSSFEFKVTPQASKILSQGSIQLTHPAHVSVDIDNWHTVNQWLKGSITLTNFISKEFSLSDGTIDITPTQITVKGTGPQVNFGLTIDKDSELSIMKWQKWLDQTGKITLFVKGLNADVKGEGNFNHEAVDLTLNGSLNGINFENLKIVSQGMPWEEISRLDTLKMKGELTATRIYKDQMSITNVVMPWEFDGKQEMARADIQASVDQNSPLKGEFKYQKGLLKYTTDIYDFPLAILPLPSQLKSLNLSKARIITDGEISAEGNGYANSQISTSDFDVKAKLLVNQFKEVKLNGQPIVLNLHISPERFKTLTQNRFEITKAFQGTFKVNKLDLKDPVDQSQVQIDMAIQPFSLKNLSDGRRVNSQGLKGYIESLSLANKINFSVEEAQGTGVLDLNGAITDAFSTPGLELSAKAQDFPTPFLIALLPPDANLGPKVEALLGSTFNAEVHANVQKLAGPVQLHLKGARSEVSLDGVVTGGFLTLNKPLVATLSVTPEISEIILDDFVPILNSAIRSDQPVKLTIGSKGFKLPVRDFSIANTNIEQAQMELGKIYFNRNGKLAQILSLLKIPSGDEFSVWFTPLYFNLVEGVFNMARVDLLIADRYPVASWGTVNFNQDQVNMYVGLTGKSLNNVFGVVGLPKNYMLAMPLRGPISNPKLDTTKVTAKLASLAAMVTGPQGLLIGGLMELALQDNVPEPTTNPLPWETDSPPGETTQNDINPAQSIQKGAKKLLENFFGG